MLEKPSMRDDIATLAGQRDWSDTRESWLARAQRRVPTVSYRTIKSIWYGAISDENHWAARDTRRAVAILEAARELRESRDRNETFLQRLNTIDPDFHEPSVAAHRGLATGIGRPDKPGNKD